MLVSKQSAGGKATAIISRRNALERYYKDPIHCKKCGSIISVKEHQKVGEVRKLQFCNHSCAAVFSNRFNRFKVRKPKVEKIKKVSPITIGLVTKKDFFAKRKNWQSARSSIQHHARTTYKNSDKPKKCSQCEYSLHYEVAHIKSVSDFSPDSTINEINHIDNLIALCPNHHWEYDNIFGG